MKNIIHLLSTGFNLGVVRESWFAVSDVVRSMTGILVGAFANSSRKPSTFDRTGAFLRVNVYP